MKTKIVIILCCVLSALRVNAQEWSGMQPLTLGADCFNPKPYSQWLRWSELFFKDRDFDMAYLSSPSFSSEDCLLIGDEKLTVLVVERKPLPKSKRKRLKQLRNPQVKEFSLKADKGFISALLCLIDMANYSALTYKESTILDGTMYYFIPKDNRFYKASFTHSPKIMSPMPPAGRLVTTMNRVMDIVRVDRDSSEFKRLLPDIVETYKQLWEFVPEHAKKELREEHESFLDRFDNVNNKEAEELKGTDESLMKKIEGLKIVNSFRE